MNDLDFRIEGKPVLDGATAGIPTGRRPGLGRQDHALEAGRRRTLYSIRAE
jgi:hypothetical protein